MADRGGLQLLQQTKKKINVPTAGGPNNTFLIGSFLFVLFIFALYGGLLWYTNRVAAEVATYDQQILDLEKQRNKQNEQELLELHKQLALIEPLMKNHIVWSDAVARIQRLVQSKIRFDSVIADAQKKTITIKAVSDNYATVAKQIAALYSEPAISEVALQRAAADSNGLIEFSMELQFDPLKFLYGSAATL